MDGHRPVTTASPPSWTSGTPAPGRAPGARDRDARWRTAPGAPLERALTMDDQTADPIAGAFVSETFDYDGGRQVTVYVPPDPPEAVVFAGDGQRISRWGVLLEAADVPATMIVGVHGLADEMPRLHEYSPIFDAARFAAHERFFVEDVGRWARLGSEWRCPRTHRGVRCTRRAASSRSPLGSVIPTFTGWSSPALPARGTGRLATCRVRSRACASSPARWSRSSLLTRPVGRRAPRRRRGRRAARTSRLARQRTVAGGVPRMVAWAFGR